MTTILFMLPGLIILSVFIGAIVGLLTAYVDSGYSWHDYKCLMLHPARGTWDRKDFKMVCPICGSRYPFEQRKKNRDV